MKIRKIETGRTQHTWDVSTPSETFVLANGCISHNSSVVIDSTNGIEMPMSLIQVKESKGSSLVQVVPEYQKYRNRYQLMWEQKDCIEYLKTAAVINAFCDQSISTNTFYSPRNYEGGKVPATVVAYNLMMSHYWGIKTFYYSLMEKTGAKAETEESETVSQITNVVEEEEHCESCVL